MSEEKEECPECGKHTLKPVIDVDKGNGMVCESCDYEEYVFEED